MKSITPGASKSGSSLLVVMSVITVIISLSVVAVQMTGAGNRNAHRERNLAKVEAVAEGALEYYYAQWKSAVALNNNSWLRSASLETLSAPTADLYPAAARDRITLYNQSIKLTDPWGFAVDAQNPNGFTSEKKVPGAGFPDHNLKNYPGWSGLAFYYNATASASMPASVGMSNPAKATISRHFQMANVSLFQCLTFFEEDLEFHPGEEMTVTGKIHTNKDAWVVGYKKLRINGNVSYSGNFSEIASPARQGLFDLDPSIPPYWADNLQAPASVTRANQLTRVERIEPLGGDPSSIFNTSDSNKDNDGFHELIEPPVNAPGKPDPAMISTRRLYNKAGAIIKINSAKGASDPGRVVVSGNGLSPSVLSAFEAAVGTTFKLYDKREKSKIPTTSIDMRKLNDAIPPGFNGIVYVHDVASGTNAVRLQNGAELTNDLTIVSEDPVYVQGDFNTGGGSNDPKTGSTHAPELVPANAGNPSGSDSPVAENYVKRSTAIIGDAVMILSNDWKDSNAALAPEKRIASNTTVNAAIIAGYLPTDYKNNNAPGGGAHNLPRFLEDWSTKSFTYTGAMVQLYVSERFQGLWDTGEIYSPPNRRWNFDTDFILNPPPGSVTATVFSRGRWERNNKQ